MNFNIFDIELNEKEYYRGEIPLLLLKKNKCIF